MLNSRPEKTAAYNIRLFGNRCSRSSERSNGRYRAIVIQNHPLVGLGLLDGVLKRKGFSITTCFPQKEDVSKIDHKNADLLIVLGGTAGAYEHDKHPWLSQLEVLIKSRIDADLPLIGSCLGGQLIAQVLGAKVYKSDKQKEVGYFPLQLTDAGKKHLISCFTADGIRVPESHGDIFELPENVELLASTERNPNQVFVKGNTLAFQFHPEATASSFEKWIQLWDKLAKDTGTYFDKDLPHEQMRAYSTAFEAKAKEFFAEWIDELVCRKDQAHKNGESWHPVFYI